jgi:hypothetical protein
MTKKLAELFDLPPSDEPESEPEIDLNEPVVDTTQVTAQAMDTLEKIDEAMPRVKGLDSTDKELDDLAELAKESYNNLMDLGMQVDSRFSSEIFAVAGTMLGHAITTKTAKINKKLKTIDLQLKQATLELKKQSQVKEIDNTPVGTGGMMDRTELLKALLEKSNNKDK